MVMDSSELRGTSNIHAVPLLRKDRFLLLNLDMQWWQSQASVLLETSYFTHPAYIKSLTFLFSIGVLIPAT